MTHHNIENFKHPKSRVYEKKKKGERWVSRKYGDDIIGDEGDVGHTTGPSGDNGLTRHIHTIYEDYRHCPSSWENKEMRSLYFWVILEGPGRARRIALKRSERLGLGSPKRRGQSARWGSC